LFWRKDQPFSDRVQGRRDIQQNDIRHNDPQHNSANGATLFASNVMLSVAMEQHTFMLYKSNPTEGSSENVNRTIKKQKNNVIFKIIYSLNPSAKFTKYIFVR
jgi:hypothetical protein